KNNIRFSKTNRDMVESMSATAERVRRYEIEYGTETVEKFLDAVLAIQEHVEPGLLKPYRLVHEEEMTKNTMDKNTLQQPATGYEDLWSLDREEKPDEPVKESEESYKPFPPQAEKDLMWFIQQYSTELEDWQRDIMT